MDQLSKCRVEIREKETPSKELGGPPNPPYEFEMGPITGRVAPPGTPVINQYEMPQASTFSWGGFPVREAQNIGCRPWEIRDTEIPVDTRGEGTRPPPIDSRIPGGAAALASGGLPGASYSRGNASGRGIYEKK